MSNETSTKQVAANRRNAQKSTGPRSSEGKKRVRRNALRHGLLAKEVVILEGDGAENRAEFEALLADLLEEFQPQGVVEETLVERIATGYWRLRRAQRYEVGAIRTSLDECQRPEPTSKADPTSRLRADLDIATADLARNERLLDFLDDLPDLADPTTFDTLIPALDRLAAGRDLPPYKPPLSPAHAEFVRSLLLAGDAEPPPQPTAADARAEFLDHLQNARLTDVNLLEPLRRAQQSVIDDLSREVAQLEDDLAAAERYDRLHSTRRRLVGSLPAEDSLHKLVRYETMLDRQIHRALTELRRRQTTPNPQSGGAPSRFAEPQGRRSGWETDSTTSPATIRARSASEGPPPAEPPSPPTERLPAKPLSPAPNPKSPIRNPKSRGFPNKAIYWRPPGRLECVRHGKDRRRAFRLQAASLW